MPLTAKHLLPSLALASLLAGCASAPKSTPSAGQSAVVTDDFGYSGPAKDRVLWQYRTALRNLREGKHDEAKALLDDAIDRISALIGKDESARKARGLFTAEARKNFIGEPYERAMAYYYRGILYWMDGEADNARACFRSAAFEDSDAVDKTYAADYVLFDYLDGLANAKLGGDGADAFKRAAEAAKLSSPPPYDTKANALFFVDYGPAPMKYSQGQYDEQLMFRSGSTAVGSLQIRIKDKTYKLRPWDDLYFQATTRGGRVMDQILANKANFKRSTDTFGNVGIVGGAVMTQHRDTQVAGLGLLAAGLLSKITSAGTTPQADTRTWDNLPHFLTFAAIQLPSGDYQATIEFLDPSDRILPEMTKQIQFTIGDSEKIIYLSDKSSTPQKL